MRSIRLFFVRDQSLFAQPFDAKTLSLSGSPRRVAEGIKHEGPGLTPFAVSAEGTVAWIPDGYNAQTDLVVMNRQGNLLQRVGQPATISRMSVDELKDLLQQAVAEMQRHFDVSNEEVRGDVRGVAEAVTALDAKFEREIASVLTEMRKGFSETQAMFKFSHAELDRADQRAGGNTSGSSSAVWVS